MKKETILEKLLNLVDNHSHKDENGDDVIYSAQIIRFIGELKETK